MRCDEQDEPDAQNESFETSATTLIDDDAPRLCHPASTSTSTSPSPRPHTGSFSDYERLEKLGSGTYGAVYKARHIVSGMLYAIKQMSIEDDDGIPQTAIREVAILRSETDILRFLMPAAPADRDVSFRPDHSSTRRSSKCSTSSPMPRGFGSSWSASQTTMHAYFACSESLADVLADALR
jgi:hypothetical protein